MSATCCGIVSEPRPMAIARGESSGPSEERTCLRAVRYECGPAQVVRVREGSDTTPGSTAYKNWKCTHWWRWCRDRLIEHLSGTKYWSELDLKDYGLLNRDFHPNHELAMIIVNKIKSGGENLDIIFWAQDTGQNMKDVIEILHLLDINSRRISFFIDV